MDENEKIENENENGNGNGNGNEQPEEAVYSFGAVSTDPAAEPAAKSEAKAQTAGSEVDAAEAETAEAAEPAEEPVDYKESIRRLKAEYKEQKRASRAQSKQEESAAGKGGISVAAAVVTSIISTLVVLGVAFALLLYFPNPGNSYFRYLVRAYTTPTQSRYPTQNSTTVDGTEIQPGDSVTINVDGEISAAAVYAKAAPSVVGIEVRRLSGAAWEAQTETVIAQGSGVVYSAQGVIITNFHVVEDAVNTRTGSIDSSYKVVVYFNTDLSEPYTVQSLLGYDADCDIALLKVDAEDLTPVEFMDSDTLTVGEPVVAIGSPGGLTFMNSVSNGIISGLGRNITSSSSGVTVYDLIQTTTAINPGNSGGALLDRQGRLAGICVIKISSTEYEGMGFAISSNTARKIAESILKYGRYIKPTLGVEVDTRYNAEAARSRGWPVGAYVATVTAGGAAAEAGVQSGDIIYQIGDVSIGSFADLRRELMKHEPGEELTVKLYRPSANKNMDLQVVLHASS